MAGHRWERWSDDRKQRAPCSVDHCDLGVFPLMNLSGSPTAGPAACFIFVKYEAAVSVELWLQLRKRVIVRSDLYDM